MKPESKPRQENRPKPASTQAAPATRASKQDFVAMLRQVIKEAMDAGKSSIDVRAADLHARVGGYPGRGHAMPSCCTCMREMMEEGDTVVSAPQTGSGAGPGLLVRYRLPRG